MFQTTNQIYNITLCLLEPPVNQCQFPKVLDHVQRIFLQTHQLPSEITSKRILEGTLPQCHRMSPTYNLQAV
jgi:hypothetical protein